MSNQHCKTALEERLWNQVDLNGPPPPEPWAPISTGCWLWTGHLAGGGYPGAIDVDGRHDRQMPHRVTYELLVGPIPEGHQLDHLCRVRHCVNPDHLEPVTPKVNAQRAWERITHCPQGHPYDETNTYVRPQGGRACRACARDRSAARRDASGNLAMRKGDITHGLL